MVRTKDQMSYGQATSQWTNNGPRFYDYTYTCSANIPKQSSRAHVAVYTKKVTFFRAIVSSLDNNVVFFVGLCATVIVILFFIVCINLVGLLNC